jgi:REP element-mobilizing transposase RayT
MTQALHRYYGAGDLHFVTFSCYQRKPSLNSDVRRDLFLKILDRVRRRYRLVVLGYVVMPEHVHLLVSEPQRETLSIVIQALKDERWKQEFEQIIRDKSLIQERRHVSHIRNTVCHMAEVPREEVERVKQVMRDWFRVVAP